MVERGLVRGRGKGKGKGKGRGRGRVSRLGRRAIA